MELFSKEGHPLVKKDIV